MATFTGSTKYKRGPSFVGRAIFDTHQGQVRVRSWPRKAKTRPTEAQLQQRAWFGEANKLFKYISPDEARQFREATEGTVFMPRDLFVKQLAGRLYNIRTTEGRKLVTNNIRTEVSDDIDSLGDPLGGILVRQQELWTPLKPGQDGTVLTSVDGLPQWQEAATGGGGGFSDAPSPGTFPVAVNTSGTKFFKAGSGQLVFMTDNGSNGVRVSAHVKPIPAAPFTALARMTGFLLHQQSARYGLVLYDENSTRLVGVWFSLTGGGEGPLIPRMTKYDGPTNHDGGIEELDDPIPNPGYIGLQWTGKDAVLRIGIDPEATVPAITGTDLDQYFTPTHVGPAISDSAETGVHISAAIQDYREV